MYVVLFPKIDPGILFLITISIVHYYYPICFYFDITENSFIFDTNLELYSKLTITSIAISIILATPGIPSLA